MAAQAPPLSEVLAYEHVVAKGLTYEQFQQQFEGRHAEWLMGDVILLVNNLQHNRIAAFLLSLLQFYFSLKPIGEAIMAGFQMYLGDDVPAREPDVVVVLNEHQDRRQEKRLEGPADIAVEVVSPESEVRDHVFKYQEYQAAGVREYWLIDPMRQQADIYVLGDDHRYRRLPLDANGRLVSTLLPNFTLDPALLWREKPPEGMELLPIIEHMNLA